MSVCVEGAGLDEGSPTVCVGVGVGQGLVGVAELPTFRFFAEIFRENHI